MQVTLTWGTVLNIVAIIGAIVALYKYFSQVVHWMDRQKVYDAELKGIKEEQCLLTYGVLACLKGLAEQGCDGPVHEAIDKIEKHMNQKAHDFPQDGMR